MTNDGDASDGAPEQDDETGQHLLCLGYGYTAAAIARAAKKAGWTVSGTTRSEEKAERMRREGVTPILWEAPAPLPAEALADANVMIASIKPDEPGCPALQGVKAGAEHIGPLHTIIYLSSTGVYGDHDGRWVNEAGPLMPDTQRGRTRLRTEHRWEDFGEEHGIAVLSLRLAGIYGPGRNAVETLIDSARRNDKSIAGRRIDKPGQVFSRVHVEDIAGLTVRLLDMAGTEDWPEEHALNVADHEPSSPVDVIDYAAELLGVAPPPLVPFEEADLSPMARSFFTDNKRVSGDCARDLTGYAFRYPGYREGLKAIYDALPEEARHAGLASAGLTMPANDR